ETQLIRITARHADPEVAAAMANAVAGVLPGYIEEAQLAGSAPGERAVNTIFVAEQARVPDSPVSPNERLNLFFGLALGLVVMVAAVGLIEYFHDDVESTEDIERLGAPVLGSVQEVPVPKGADRQRWQPRVEMDSAGSAFSEALGQLQANLAFAL